MNLATIERTITCKRLEINDTFYIYYGYGFKRFRVHRVLGKGYLIHRLVWCKSDSIFMTYKEIETSKYEYYNKISKFRAFFLL